MFSMIETEQLAIPLEGVQAVVAWHNIVGSAGVLNAAVSAVEKRVGDHYASRAIDQIPFSHHLVARYVFTSDPAELKAQAAYRGQLCGLDFEPITDLSELAKRGVQNALFVPYIRLKAQDLPTNIHWMQYGLPPDITGALKNKADLHTWLLQHGFAEHTPNHIICRADQIAEKGRIMLAKIDEMYADCGMSGSYPLGLMIRGAQSDGNYGMASVRQAVVDEYVEGVPVRKLEFVLRKDGKGKTVEVFSDWNSALQAAQDHINTNVDPTVETKVVMTRLIRLRESPGMSAVAAGGDLTMLGFNGQYIEPGHTACVGTSTFSEAVGVETARFLSDQYLAQSQHVLNSIMHHFMDHRLDRDQIYAMFNIDMMIPDTLEETLWYRVNQNPALFRYRDNVGRCNDDYAPRVYAPHTALIAEINPRDTNWTLAMKAVLQSLQLPCTVENLKRLSYGDDVRVVARDQWELPERINFHEARERLLAYHHSLPEGDGFILRMPDRPAGVIVYTHSHDHDRIQEISEGARAVLER